MYWDDPDYQRESAERRQTAVADAYRRRRNLLIVLPLVILSVLALRQLGALSREIPPLPTLTPIPQPTATPVLLERLALAGQPSAVVETRGDYIGGLWISVTGILFTDVNSARDAFYEYLPPQPDVHALTLRPLTINGQPVTDLLRDPPFSADGAYWVPYDAGRTPQRLRFALAEDIVGGALTIAIYRR